ncbi:hypothetical protein LEP1GSC132_2767 [Leptospira kirschneri str. 200803703]|nr:hypothetical protein LEP1GSC044_3210 [Leptospira kirschneri serovar Grippotyphosa str. RM52]EKQ83559.1 hypothetical protein LEP1GSC064_2518 [Leptospira kirschneri serovar Grippotyphosa str. Moskva]EKR08921.1 hypothetical protein LEP1GSC122_0634 [Leptospira kirschneri serovar Valbuzzi str. 200702274]EMK12957.1 hypothetical protein LEP1GSC042_2714 [Leptospira kirschneri serovar Bim str. PUO 1247]EMN24057.1 hypothetical protein LEP1GSC065_1794 [Leptospira kirschneri serovar Sokoine str. RM1]EM
MKSRSFAACGLHHRLTFLSNCFCGCSGRKFNIVPVFWACISWCFSVVSLLWRSTPSFKSPSTVTYGSCIFLSCVSTGTSCKNHCC